MTNTNNILTVLETAIESLVVPLNPDLSTLDGGSVAKMWTDQAMSVREMLIGLHGQVKQVVEQAQGRPQAPAPMFHRSSEDEVIALAKQLYASAQAAQRNVLPQESIERAKNFFEHVKTLR